MKTNPNNWGSTSVINYNWLHTNVDHADIEKYVRSSEEDAALQFLSYDIHFVMRPCLEKFKKFFGRQTYTWVGSDCRFWVWEFDEQIRIFVNSRKGICVELRHDLQPKVAYAAMIKFVKDIKEKQESGLYV